MSGGKTYIAIDLKSFYASVECVERGLDPLSTHLVVADESRTDKTICLAVTPSLKALGVSGRPRLFEVKQRVRELNRERRRKAPGHTLGRRSAFPEELKRHPSYELDFIIAPPRMAKYMEVSSRVYEVYLKYIAPEDIHVYSVDEVFIDATGYLRAYKIGARGFAAMLISDVLNTTGITATAGVGTNLYLAKIAMDIMAKHIPADKNGARIAELDEMSYRRKLWAHRPLTDFWRIGGGISSKLEPHGMFTMGDIARCSVENEDLLYKLFGVNAELLIDHAWGWEPCEIADIKAYRPESRSLSSGQVLPEPYTFDKARLIVREMADLLSLQLVEKRVVTDQIVLDVCYDTENLSDAEKRRAYFGEVHFDHYGRAVPKSAHGSLNLETQTSSTKKIVSAAAELFDRITNRGFTIRKITIACEHILNEEALVNNEPEQLDLFTDYERQEREEQARARERELQRAVVKVKGKYGKNALLKGMNFEDGGKTIERNGQVGGHRA
ncbi:MAG: DNA methylase [Oscillospiraceae bacterium]|nr:DNA methylase [Oscillospiraceae bacterium]